MEMHHDLPRGWTEQRIEQLFAPLEDGRTLHQGWSPQCDKVPSPSEDVWAVLKTTSIQAGEFQPEHNKLLPRSLEPRPMIEIREGDILITCAGPRVRCGVSCLVRQTRKRLMMSGKMYRFRVDANRTDDRYVEAFLQTERARLAIDKMKTGSSDSGLNLTHDRFRQLLIPVAPLPEQRRIVAEIEQQFTRLEALRRVQANLKRYRAAVLKAACEGRIVPTEAELAKTGNRKAKFETGEELLARILTERRQNWRGRGQYKEPVAPVIANLPPFLKSWAVASLEQLTSAARPICYGILMPKENVASGVLFVKVKDMKGDKIDLEGLHRTTPEIAAKYARASLRTGDLLLSIRGTYGRVAEVPKKLNGGNITQDTARLDVTGLVDHRYVATCLRNPDCQNYFKRVARGVAVKGVNIGDVRPTPIPLPPLAEQMRIVAEVERRLSVVEELEAVVSANLQRATRLRQSILQKAFTGELTC
jgi:type I restriction enzyme S subunit